MTDSSILLRTLPAIGLAMMATGGAATPSPTAGGPPSAAAWETMTVDLVFDDFDRLAERKRRIRQGDPKAIEAHRNLLTRADRLLTLDPPSVVRKDQTAPSGDKHDYLSLAPYWWPDPAQPDGLPWIRRDGRINPKTRGDHVDYPAKELLFNRVSTLGLAAFYSEEPQYAAGAVALLHVWFVDPATRMNPHLEYAQGIPGRNDGRCFGIIEWCDLGDLLTPIQLLRAGGALPAETDQALVTWFTDYLRWLQASEMGRMERDRQNNHGTWYDVQVAGLLLFLDRDPEARDVLEAVKVRRIAPQIEPDGRQPHELARTKSLSYSRMNLSAFRRLTALGNKLGVDLWNFETTDGRSIRKAAEFLAPYLNGKKKWEYPQL